MAALSLPNSRRVGPVQLPEAVGCACARDACRHRVSGAESRTFYHLAGAASACMSNPCLSCGACCAHFRASFHWLETSLAPGGVTPAELTAPVTRHRVAMLGTDREPPRCIALEGRIGDAVRCTIYDRRASPCRDFQASWADGVHNERCDRARAAHGLPLLSPPLLSPEVRRMQSNSTDCAVS